MVALRSGVGASPRQRLGRRGWTCATLAALNETELKAALEMAWRHAAPKAKPKRR